MQYFDTLPKIIYTDTNGVRTIRTNLLARASLIPSIFSNPLIYYNYSIQEGDTPEIIAHKYYNDMYRYWIIMLSNQLLHPQWNWPLDSNQFDAYLNDKYSPGTLSNVYEYQKIITQVDQNTQTVTTNTFVIDQTAYNSLTPSNNTYVLPTGPVSVSITKNAMSYYDYEVSTNEAKRNIQILNNKYVDEFETEFSKLMKA